MFAPLTKFLSAKLCECVDGTIDNFVICVVGGWQEDSVVLTFAIGLWHGSDRMVDNMLVMFQFVVGIVGRRHQFEIVNPR